MPNDSRNRAPNEDPPYRVCRSNSSAPPRSDDRPYNVYRSAPRGLPAPLPGPHATASAGGAGPGRGPGHERKVKEGWRGRITPGRVLKYLAIAIGAWLLLSLVLFLVSAQINSGGLPASATNALSPGGNMLTSTNTI